MANKLFYNSLTVYEKTNKENLILVGKQNKWKTKQNQNPNQPKTKKQNKTNKKQNKTLNPSLADHKHLPDLNTFK